MRKENTAKAIVLFWFIVVLFLLFPGSLYAQESTCAKVKIEIKQELTLERQAFDAHMRINNGLIHTSLENINVDVWFTDEQGNSVLASSDPDNIDALFFIRLDDMTNIEDVSGSGSVPPDSSSDINWLIIPSPGASNGLESGTLYNVGATLTYTVGGEENVIEVSPDYIFVKPMPELMLDYFLPSDVYGDDPFTSEIEPSLPFSMGVRVKNTGAGSAQNLKIDSAQPKIVDNDQGLLINFNIQGSQVNGQDQTESLLVNFGAIEPGTSAIARWIMNCKLSGRFVEFKAQYSHSDELGGELTSLIDTINTHTLVQDVLVDLPGRDAIKDFLARADDLYRVYESDTLETDVTDLSGSSTLVFKSNNGTESHYTLTVSVTSGFVYTKFSDPHFGTRLLKEVIRSDGKIIKPSNGWLSKTQDRETHNWSYFVNLFDADTTGSYTLIFDALSAMPQKPVLQFIPNKSGIEGQQISFIVEASDPNGTIPSLSAGPLPAGAQFTDNKDGTGIFDWTPVQGQKGSYNITFSASDGSLTANQRVLFVVYDIADTDMDGMIDSWETDNFSSLERDGTGDFDNDGISDLQEFEDNTDPTLDESAPSIPDPLYPHPNVDVEEASPELVIENSTDSQDDAIAYEFEIYTDPQMTDMVASDDDVAQAFNETHLLLYSLVASNEDVPVPQTGLTTNWQVPVSLPDNARYFWRVRSKDAEGSSLWAYQSFFVNTQNDPPSIFHISSPDNSSDVDSLSPRLTVLNSTDVDNDVITYSFEVYEDPEMTTLAASSGEISQQAGSTSWTVNTELSDQTTYFWRAVAVDSFGAQTATELGSFFVNTANHAPSTPMILSPDGQTEIETLDVLLGVENSTDPDSDPISYVFEIDTSDKFDSPDRQISDEIFEGADKTWWMASGLKENRQYYWRAKANDGRVKSEWANASFFVNQMNEAPSVPTIKNPGSNAWVDTRTPVLSVNRSLDPDQDRLEYRFELYSNPALTHFVVQADSSGPDWTVNVNLKNNTRYYWRAQALDEHGVTSAWTPVSDFFVNIDLVNQAPKIEIIEPLEDLVTRAQTIEIQWIDSDPDSRAAISLYYDTDNQGEDGVLIADNIEEDPDGDQDSYTWDISSLQDGTYYIYALISDEDTTVSHYAPVKITIDRTPPVLTITPEQGSYDDPQSIVIEPDETADIYYTVDGSDPGPGSSLYTDPIEVSETTELKCMAKDPAGNISEIITRTYVFNLNKVTLNVATGSGNPIPDTKVYIFKASGSYCGISGKTDIEGNALFDPDLFVRDSYQFRIDYLGHQFWTDPVQLPDDMYTAFVIQTETVTLDVTTANGPAAGYKVYLFSETGAYLGQYQKTDENGRVSFELPVGVSYKYRSDVLGT